MIDDELLEKVKTGCPYYEETCNLETCYCSKYYAYKDAQNPQIVERTLKKINIDNNLGKLEKVLKIQKHFASRFHEVENPDKEITDKWNKEYCICIEDEVEELFDYIGFDVDIDNSNYFVLEQNSLVNMKKEIIDIFHFVLDMIISGGLSAEKLTELFLKKRTEDILSVKDSLTFMFKFAVKAIEETYNLMKLPSFEHSWIKDNKDSVDMTVKDENAYFTKFALKVLFSNRKIRKCISWKHWKKPSNTINYEKLYDAYEEMFFNFMLLSAFVFKDVDELVNMYISKNVENLCRQEYSY